MKFYLKLQYIPGCADIVGVPSSVSFCKMENSLIHCFHMQDMWYILDHAYQYARYNHKSAY